jgi:hypothetical protein
MHSKVLAVEPSVRGLQVSVLGGDDQLELTNGTGKTVLILGYNREPFLRFGPDGVYENRTAPSTYISRDRYGRGALPDKARVGAEPEWRRVSSTTRWHWHDHRIHWMSPIAPPVVQREPGARHHVLSWSVPGRAGGARFAIAGTLDYVPASNGSGSGRVIAFAVGLAVSFVLATGAILLLRRPRSAQPAGRRAA